MLSITRAAAAVLSGLGLLCGAASAQAPALPNHPVTISVVDVAGNLALTQPAFEQFRKEHPNLVSRFVFSQAPAPDLPGKLRAQQAAGRLDIDLVLTGTDALSAGMAQDVWLPILPQFGADFPNLDANYLPGADAMFNLFHGVGLVIAYYPSGPLLEYAPGRVASPPGSAEELAAYCHAHPGKFMYARPANSGPGRTFLMGLPYILGDKDPKDPVNGWEKTWAYLKDLNSCIDYYPSGTTVTMKELGEGSRDVIVTTTGWDINPRVLGIVPEDAKVATLRGFHWVTDAHYMAVPRGIAPDKLAVVLQVMQAMLTPPLQAYEYDKGYFYPGPAVRDVPLSMAPQESQDVLKQYGRPEYDQLIAGAPLETPLDPDKMVAAFHKWDEEIGATKTSR